ncbi:MAG: helicase HerA-like domain-containing protein, partial [Pseudomonadota bacterium]
KDRESAFELLTARAEQAAKEAEAAETAEEEAETMEREYRAARRYSGARVNRSTSRRVGAESVGSALGSAIIKELKGTTGRRIVRGVLGGLFKGR